MAINLVGGTGYGYSIESGNVEVGTTVSFSVTLEDDYNESVITVKANGEVLTAENGVYSFVASANTEITVEGVQKNIVSVTFEGGEGFTYSATNTQVEVGTTLTFTVELDAKYSESDYTVKANGTVITADAGVYTVVASENIKITVEGVERNQVVVGKIFAGYNGTASELVNVAGKYEHSTLVVGNDKVYSSTLPLAYVTLAKYTQIRFAIYAENGTWFQIGKDGEFPFAGASAQWCEIKLVRESDKYQAYFNGEWVNFNLPLDANLNEMNMKLATSGNFYLSEIRGVEDENYVESDGYAHGEVFVADAFVGFSGTESDYINTLGGYKKSTAISGSNTTYNGSKLVSVDLDRYLEIRFSICLADANKYVEMGLVANGDFKGLAFSRADWTWDDFRLVRDGDVVKFYRNGHEVSKLQLSAVGNLSDIQVKFATSGTFYVSEVVGIKDPNYVEKVEVNLVEGVGFAYSIESRKVVIGSTVSFSVILEKNYSNSVITVKANGEVLTAEEGVYSFEANADTEITVEGVMVNEVVAADVPADFSGTASDFINTAGGYSKSTAVEGSNTNYKGKTLVDIDLAKYNEFRFSVYCPSDKWLEIGFVSEGNFKALSTTGAKWTEFKFVNEGNGYFQAYTNGTWKSVTIPLDARLSVLQMRIATSGTFYLSEVRCVVNPNYVEPEYADGYSRVADLIADGEGTESDVINTDGGYKKSTVINGTYQVLSLVDIDLSKYTEIRFSIYCGGDKYVEIGSDSNLSTKLSFHGEKWTEVVLKNEGNGVFQAYRNGEWYNFKISVDSNLSDCVIRLGNGGTFYFSEVLCK